MEVGDSFSIWGVNFNRVHGGLWTILFVKGFHDSLEVYLYVGWIPSKCIHICSFILEILFQQLNVSRHARTIRVNALYHPAVSPKSAVF